MEIGEITIELDKRWALYEFSIFSKEYVQLYNFFYVLKAIEEEEKFFVDFSTYPWEGGYSVVNFFRRLDSYVIEEHELKVNKIRYESPGFIELTGIVASAADVAAVIGSVCGSILAVNKTYDAILSSYRRRRLAKLKIIEKESQLDNQHSGFIREANEELISILNLKPRHLSALKKLSKGNELIQLKILLALLRRAKPLALTQDAGKSKIV